MENSIKAKLIEIKKNVSLLQTFSSYSKTLSEIFIKDISLFHIVCDTYDISSEELLAFLANNELKNIPLLDELIQFCSLVSEQKGTNTIEYGR